MSWLTIQDKTWHDSIPATLDS